MTARLILTYPDNRLRETSDEVSSEEFEKVLGWCRDIRDTMIANSGVSLAAPQIGIQKRIFAINTSEVEKPYTFSQNFEDGLLYFVNPKLLSVSSEAQKICEVCLSIHGANFTVKRGNEIHLSYMTKNSEQIEVKISGRDAVLIQHEIDHLEGKLLVDRLNVFDKKAFFKERSEPKRQKSEAEIIHQRMQKRAKTRANRKK